MHEAFAILLCSLAIFGLYALFSRIAIALLPHGALALSVDGRGRTCEEILLLTESAKRLAEREKGVCLKVSVLLDENEQEKLMSLRKEGILVYIIKSEKGARYADGDEGGDPMGLY